MIELDAGKQTYYEQHVEAYPTEEDIFDCSGIGCGMRDGCRVNCCCDGAMRRYGEVLEQCKTCVEPCDAIKRRYD